MHLLPTAKADVTGTVSSIDDLRALVLGSNVNCSSEVFTAILTQDIQIESVPTGNPEYNGTGLPFIRPNCGSTSKPSVVIDGNGFTIFRNPRQVEEFRLTAILRSSGSSGAFRAGKLVLKNVTISGFAFTDRHGGALFVDQLGSLTLENVTLTNNRVRSDGVPSVHGGAIYSQGKLQISNSTITNNEADFGGGIFLTGIESGKTLITESYISDNRAETDERGLGGGIYVSNRAEIELSDSFIEHNNAFSGGGIYFHNSVDSEIRRSTIHDNHGGGIVSETGFASYNLNPASIDSFALYIDASTISNNSTATPDIGAGLSLKGQYAYLRRVTLVNNRGESGITLMPNVEKQDSLIRINSSLISGNTSVVGGANEISCDGQVHNPADSIALVGSVIGHRAISGDEAISTDCDWSNKRTFPPSNLEMNTIFATSSLPSTTPVAQQAIIHQVPKLVKQIFLPLADNSCHLISGSETNQVCSPTHALAENSIALNATRFTSSRDQRNMLPLEFFADVGAYEGFISAEQCYVVPIANNNVVTFCL